MNLYISSSYWIDFGLIYTKSDDITQKIVLYNGKDVVSHIYKYLPVRFSHLSEGSKVYQ